MGQSIKNTVHVCDGRKGMCWSLALDLNHQLTQQSTVIVTLHQPLHLLYSNYCHSCQTGNLLTNRCICYIAIIVIVVKLEICCIVYKEP